MRRIGVYGLVLVAGCMLFIGSMTSGEEVAVPAAINYQGKLTNPSDGKPVQAGVYHIEFRVWDDPTDTAANDLIWGRVFAVHVMTNGVFNILLTDAGTAVTSPSAQTNDIRQAFQGEDRYLGLTITHGPSGNVNSPEISPRQRMVSAPFAFHSQNATDAFHAKQADEAVLAQDSEKLGGKLPSKYYDNARFDAIGLNSSYKTILGWMDGGGAFKTDLVDYWGQFCMSSSAPSDPDDGVKFLVQGGKIQADDGIIAKDQIELAPGESDKGLQFPENIGGGTGDKASIQYYARTNEDCTLKIAVENDAEDKMRLESSGNIDVVSGESVVLKNSGRVEIFGPSVEYVMNQWYQATGDGMVTYYGYHGHMWYYQYQDDGSWVTDGDTYGNHWRFFFTQSGADTMVLTMPVGKGDKINFADDSDGYHPSNWKVRWKPFGNGTLVTTTAP